MDAKDEAIVGAIAGIGWPPYPGTTLDGPAPDTPAVPAGWAFAASG